MIHSVIILTPDDLHRARRHARLSEMTLSDVARIDAKLLDLAELVLLLDPEGVAVLKSRRNHAGVPRGAVLRPGDLTAYLLQEFDPEQCIHLPTPRQAPIAELTDVLRHETQSRSKGI